MNVAGQTPQAPTAGKLARWAALLGATVVTAAIVAFASGPGSYSDRLLELDARSSLVLDVYRAASGSPELQALFLDASRKPQLLAKMQFAMQNYPADARDVLIAFGGYEEFRKALLDYGEQIVPVIGYFQKNELKSMKLRFEAGRGWDGILGKGRGDPDKIYGPEYRGLFAIEAIRLDGHSFLAQFRIDDQKNVIWLITPQVTTFITDFFTSGMATVEEKIRLRQKVSPADMAWGAADVVVGAAFFKWLKGLKAIDAGATAGRGAHQAAMVDKAAVSAGKVLTRDGVATALKLSGNAAAIYLTARHPDLISGLFEDIGGKLGLSPFFSKLIGWSLLLSPVMAWLLPLALAALSALIPALLALASLGAWLRGRAHPR